MERAEQMDYIKATWSLIGDKAERVMNQANNILNQAPDGEWYKHTVKRAGEENRDVETHALHEAYWKLYGAGSTGNGNGGTTPAKAGFLGLPNMVWYVVGAGVLYYGYTQGWFGKKRR